MTFMRRMIGGSYSPSPGNPKPVRVSGSDREFFATRFHAPETSEESPDTRYWFVYDQKTGMAVHGGETLSKALIAAAFLFQTTPNLATRLESLPDAPKQEALF